jgi:hypothetical protein
MNHSNNWLVSRLASMSTKAAVSYLVLTLSFAESLPDKEFFVNSEIIQPCKVTEEFEFGSAPVSCNFPKENIPFDATPKKVVINNSFFVNGKSMLDTRQFGMSFLNRNA